MIQKSEVRSDLIQTLIELNQSTEIIREVTCLLRSEEEMRMMLIFLTIRKTTSSEKIKEISSEIHRRHSIITKGNSE